MIFTSKARRSGQHNQFCTALDRVLWNFHRRTAVLGIAVIQLTALGSPIAAQDNQHGDARAGAVLHVERDGGPLLAHAAVSTWGTGVNEPRAETYTMLVDTGASATMIDLSHLKWLGEPVDKLPLAGSVPKEVDVFTAPVFEIGALRLRPKGHVACVDLKWLSQGAGLKIDGLLGSKFAPAICCSPSMMRGQTN